PAPPTDDRMIALDPGHGGSDPGAIGNGLTEKVLTLDISNRLRDVLLARGWKVTMTRTRDVDVYQPNDSARDELQARDDIANAAGARLLVSVHINSYTSSWLNGTTTYYYKPDALPLAQAIHARLAAMLPTKDDGIQKANFYVIHHCTMPAVLVETAFLSNPGDAADLREPAFLQKVAIAIADGVADYAGQPTAGPATPSPGE
ncbi:MAG: N-acetylmuramoyl-L-alanine amidase family protein, partial [Vulcanimicrobiaceae bacterium]